jgi:hypothetical protein
MGRGLIDKFIDLNFGLGAQNHDHAYPKVNLQEFQIERDPHRPREAPPYVRGSEIPEKYAIFRPKNMQSIAVSKNDVPRAFSTSKIAENILMLLLLPNASKMS